ncbi:MAG TPA: endonuclease/exonuclease/phosphatase family protein [Tepidisphaeraceae bacterium]|jgi:hypothetical protein|nr:endonuclease/exonuclease/phosphatase family protein [Tepidisphaeraceae bacterium]
MPRKKLVVFGVVVLMSVPAARGTLRIVSYNIDSADQGNDNNITASYAGLPTVIEGIGEHHIGTTAQPVDVFAVEEINTTTLPNLVTAMNNIYGAGTYAYVNISDPATSANYDGLIYNTKTVQILASKVIGTVSGSGAARAPLRFQIQPLGYGTNADFYMYVDHYKADSDATSANRRNIEAQEVRADADTLGSSAHIIFAGDYNLTGASSEASYQTLVAAGGSGRAYDPVAASFVSPWVNSSSTWKYLYSQSTTSLGSRIDLQLVSNPVLTQPGLQLEKDTSDPYTGNFPSSQYGYAYEVFGNNGSTALHAAVNSTSNTALNDLTDPMKYLNALKNFDSNDDFVGSDHMPLVADYDLVGITPLWLAWKGGNGNWSTATQWHAGLVPNDGTVEARLDYTISGAASVITLDQNATVKDVLLAPGNTLDINAGQTLTLNGPTTSVLNGKVNNAGTFAPASSVPVTVVGTFTNSGTATFGSGVQWTGPGAFVNSAGTGTFNADTGSVSSTPLTVNAGGGNVVFNSSQHLQGLNLSGATHVSVAAGGAVKTISVKGISISGTGTLDIAGNTLVVSYVGGSSVDSIRGYLRNASIFSSTANADAQHRLAIGYSDSGSAITTQITYLGDANLDGVVNADDYALVDRTFAKHLADPHWVDGDFNYDGVVNSADYLLMDRVYGEQTGGLSPELLAEREAIFGAGYVSELVASVPEPGVIGVACLGLLMARRRVRTQNYL